MQVLAVGNQKGGTAKTTTAASLGVVLSRQGIRVHLVDMDPQANLTRAFGRRDDDALLFQALAGREGLPVTPIGEYLSLTPSSVDLAKAESQFIAEPGRESILKTCLQKTSLADDVLVIVDCPPSLGVLGLNCLLAAEKLLVAVQPGGFELQALGRLQDTIAVLRDRIKHDLEIVGVVLTNCHMRRAITAQVQEKIGQRYPVLGAVRQDAEMLYATTEGRLHELQRSRALDDYTGVAARLRELMPWRERLAV